MDPQRMEWVPYEWRSFASTQYAGLLVTLNRSIHSPTRGR
jgi:hypothetical protein